MIDFWTWLAYTDKQIDWLDIPEEVPMRSTYRLVGRAVKLNRPICRCARKGVPVQKYEGVCNRSARRAGRRNDGTNQR